MEARIGQAAGKVWKVLSTNKIMAANQMAKAAGLPSDLANQAIGWLAREGKVTEEVSVGKAMLRLKTK